MRHVILVLAGLLAAPLAPAQADLISSPTCKSARVELDAALEEAAATRSRSRRLDAARKEAAAACFGAALGNAAPRSGAPEPAQSVPPPRISAAPPSPMNAPLPPVSTPLPPVNIPRAAFITHCDPGGCWDSEGRRLNQAGPVLIGPRGACVTQGGVVTCP